MNRYILGWMMALMTSVSVVGWSTTTAHADSAKKDSSKRHQHDHKGHDHKTQDDQAEKKSETPTTQPVAINTMCPIGKEEIDPEVTYVHEGQTIGFCCEPCIGKFKKDPAKHMKDLK